MHTKNQIYFLSPISRIVALALGVVFAVAHHVFYLHLDGREADTGGYVIAGMFELSRQHLNNNAGIAFAFLVKAFLTTAVSIAFVQAFWRALLVDSSTRAPKLDVVDAIYSLLSSVRSMFSVAQWWRYPLVFVLALISLLHGTSVANPTQADTTRSNRRTRHVVHQIGAVHYLPPP